MAALTAPGRYPALDGLRALAILMVFVTHCAQQVPGLSYVAHGREWLFFLYNGWMGVDLFVETPALRARQRVLAKYTIAPLAVPA